MDRVTLHDLIKHLGERMLSMVDHKAVDYAGGEDLFGGFKRRAAQAGLTPAQVCYNDLSKHADAIGLLMKPEPKSDDDGRYQNRYSPTQGLHERLFDLLTYGVLLYGITDEAQYENRAVPMPGPGKPEYWHREKNAEQMQAAATDVGRPVGLASPSTDAALGLPRTRGFISPDRRALMVETPDGGLKKYVSAEPDEPNGLRIVEPKPRFRTTSAWRKVKPVAKKRRKGK